MFGCLGLLEDWNGNPPFFNQTASVFPSSKLKLYRLPRYGVVGNFKIKEPGSYLCWWCCMVVVSTQNRRMISKVMCLAPLKQTKTPLKMEAKRLWFMAKRALSDRFYQQVVDWSNDIPYQLVQDFGHQLHQQKPVISSELQKLTLGRRKLSPLEGWLFWRRFFHFGVFFCVHFVWQRPCQWRSTPWPPQLLNEGFTWSHDGVFFKGWGISFSKMADSQVNQLSNFGGLSSLVVDTSNRRWHLFAKYLTFAPGTSFKKGRLHQGSLRQETLNKWVVTSLVIFFGLG